MKDLSLKEWGKVIAKNFIKAIEKDGFWAMTRS